MKAGQVILLAAGAGAAYYLFTTSQGVAKNLTVQVLSGGFTSANVKEITGNIEFRVINPEKVNLTVNNVFFKIFANNTEVGTATTETPVNIGRVSSKNFKINFGLPLLSVLSSVPSLIDSLADGNTKFSIAGFIDTNVGRINMQQTV